MVANSTLINRDIYSVWAKIQTEFCKTFKCTPAELQGKTIKVETKSYLGDPIVVQQVVSEYIPQREIALQSVNGADVVTSKYLLKEVGPNTTEVKLTVRGQNTQSKLKNWNYSLMSIPVLRAGTKKRLKRQLAQFKSVVESEGAR